jgi:hypothetical protein
LNHDRRVVASSNQQEAGTIDHVVGAIVAEFDVAPDRALADRALREVLPETAS